MTIAEAFEAFEVDELISENRSKKTIDSYRCTLNSLLRSLGDDVPIAFLAYSCVISWKKDMHEWDNRTSYIAQQLRNFRSVLSYLKNHGFETLNPSEIKIPKFKYRETAWLTMDEMGRFLAAINDPMYKALFAMQFSAGGRISEMLSLNRADAKAILRDRTIRVRGKGQKEVSDILQFDDNALECLKDYLKTRRDKLEPLFLSRQRNRLHITTAIQAAHRFAKRAGIEKNVATHVMRHSFGTNLDLNGMDIYNVSKQMRHSRIETTKVYIHSGDINRRKDYDKYHTPTPL